MILPDDLDPNAELVAAITFTPGEQAERDALLVEMKLDSDALFEEVARSRAADDALLMQAVRDGADALAEMLRQNSSIPPLPGGISKSCGIASRETMSPGVGRRPGVFEGGGSGRL